MITNKQRAELRGMANTIETIFQIGKGGVTEAVVAQVDEALTARELIKLKVLQTAPCTAREAAQVLAQNTSSEIVQVIGGKLVLYRRNNKNPIIELKK